MKLPRVYPILDTAALEGAGCDPQEAAAAMLQGGARILQFRHKQFWDKSTVELAGRVSALCASAGALFIVNDRADYAKLVGAGVHLGQEDLTPADARIVVGLDAVVGYSTHSTDQMQAADTEPADYLAFGPIFPTVSKYRPDATVGLDLLRDVRRLTRKPLVAIGGITRKTAPLVWGAGADSVAFIADLIPDSGTPAAIQARVTEWCKLSL